MLPIIIIKSLSACNEDNNKNRKNNQIISYDNINDTDRYYQRIPCNRRQRQQQQLLQEKQQSATNSIESSFDHHSFFNNWHWLN
ncbi:hypothetical protein DERF_013471 [Dermatophagoides farinae]|uniref:Uncharacterized protein n=1 Tax=Dermatophagoides farinae TaxID=6954 RepID=A0A922HMD7_DERFA|nr:hypothetical protein DERF_013471 [Dermatophagoides farinae]